MPFRLPEAGEVLCLCCGDRPAQRLERIRPHPIRPLFCSEECALLYAVLKGAEAIMQEQGVVNRG